MKNLLHPRQLFNVKLLIKLFVFSIPFVLSSCEKQESMIPSQVQSAAEDRTEAMPVIPEFLLKIDHVSQGAQAADYSVILWADGSVQFNGRNNVSSPGIHNRTISLQDVAFIRNLYQSSMFSSLPTASPVAQSLYIKTTFSVNSMAVSVIDLDNGSPMIIKMIREKAEEIMGISDFINDVPSPGQIREGSI